LDADGNGTLDEGEFVAVCVGDGTDAAAAADAKKLFLLLDEDHSGSVSCGELGHALHNNKEAKKLAKHFAALHDLVHMAHGRKHHKPHHHGDDDGAGDGSKHHSHHHRSSHHHHKDDEKEAAAARYAAFSKLDANGDGSLDYEEFLGVCGGDDPDTVRKLFDSLDIDLSGSLEVEELAKALASDPEAQELAKHFDALHDLIDLSTTRKSRHHKHHKHKPHKQRHADMLEEKKVSLVTELFGTGDPTLMNTITATDARLQKIAKQSGATGDKARELVKVLEEEAEEAKIHRRRKLRRQNSQRQHGGGRGGGSSRGRSRRRSKMARRDTNQRPSAPAANAPGGTRRKSSRINMVQVGKLRQSQQHRVAQQRWRSTKARMKLLSATRPSARGPLGSMKMKSAQGPRGSGV